MPQIIPSTTLLEMVDRASAIQPETPAILGLHRAPLAYGGLISEARTAAALLQALGLRRNQRAALVLPNGPEMASAFLAVSAIATSAPLNPAYSQDEFEFYLSDLGASALLTSEGCAPAAVRAAEKLGVRVLWLRPDESRSAGCFSLSNEDAAGGQVQFAQPDDTALVLHTSGTTARPKIVPLTHRNLVTSARNIATSLRLAPNDLCLNIMPLFHVHGLIGAVLATLAAGGTVACTPGFNPEEFFGWLADFQPTWYTAVPTMHQSILAKSATLARPPLHHRVRFIRSCSSALAPRLMKELESVFGVPVIEALGMTEGSHQVATNRLPPGKRKPGSVGVPVGPEIAVMDQAGQILSAEVTGEIVIRGQSVMGGYENNPKANHDSFSGGWFRTGDQGHIDAEGFVFLTGRIKEMINRGGEKISPREIDETLLECPEVAQAVAFAVPDPDFGEAVGAAVVLRDGAAITEEEIRRFAGARLAHFKIPCRVLIVPDIPKGPTGKLQRISMARLLGISSVEQMRGQRASFAAPESATEELVAGIWEQVLHAGKIGLLDNLFDLGANSLAVTQIAARLQQILAVPVSLSDLYETPTVKEQAATLEQRCPASSDHRGDPTACQPVTQPPGGFPAPAETPPLTRRTNVTEVPLSFAQKRFWFLSNLEPESAAFNRAAFLRLSGVLKREALGWALNEIVRRHEVLRVSIPETDGEPAGLLHPWEPAVLSHVELAEGDESSRNAELARLAAAASRAPFDLARGPLWRAQLLRLNSEDHLLLLVFHHIVFDGWSEHVLTDELQRLYEAGCQSERAPWPELPLQYADYAAWQSLCLKCGAWDADLRYWKEELGGDLPVLCFTASANGPVRGATGHGARLRSHLSPEMTLRLKALCQREQATLVMVLLAAFKVILHRCSGQNDLIVGCMVAGRDRIELELLIGCFVNTIVIRTKVEVEGSFRDLLAQVRHKTLCGYQHQSLPFEKVLEAIHPVREVDRTPVFQTLFNHHTANPQAAGHREIRMVRWNHDAGTTPADLALDVCESPDGIECIWEFSTDCHSGEEIRHMEQSYLTLLASIASNPTQSIKTLPCLPETERKEFLLDANGCPDDPQVVSITELLEVAEAVGESEMENLLAELEALPEAEAESQLLNQKNNNASPRTKAFHPTRSAFHCPENRSAWFGRRRCNLILLINQDINRESFERLARQVREFDPLINAAVLLDQAGRIPDLPDCPTLTFSPAAVRHPAMARGRTYCGLPLSKSQEYDALEKAGIQVPRWVLLSEGVTPDLRGFGEYVVHKPDYGGKGAKVFLVPKREVRWKPITTRAAGTSSSMIIQEFIRTGPQPVCYRVNTLFGRVLYSVRHELPNQESHPLKWGSIVASGRSSRDTLNFDDEIIRLAEAAANAFPDIPLLGFDIVREKPSEKLYVLEANAIGYVWNFHSRQVAEYGFSFEKQFDGLRKAAYILAEKTQEHAC